MTTTDYTLMAASAATILTVAAYWWRRSRDSPNLRNGTGLVLRQSLRCQLRMARAHRGAPLQCVDDRKSRAVRRLDRRPVADRRAKGDGPRGGRGAAPRG